MKEVLIIVRDPETGDIFEEGVMVVPPSTEVISAVKVYLKNLSKDYEMFSPK